LTSQNFTF